MWPRWLASKSKRNQAIKFAIVFGVACMVAAIPLVLVALQII
jgi:uncharacterized membrane protein (DUF485 family)